MHSHPRGVLPQCATPAIDVRDDRCSHFPGRQFENFVPPFDVILAAKSLVPPTVHHAFCLLNQGVRSAGWLQRQVQRDMLMANQPVFFHRCLRHPGQGSGSGCFAAYFHPLKEFRRCNDRLYLAVFFNRHRRQNRSIKDLSETLFGASRSELLHVVALQVRPFSSKFIIFSIFSLCAGTRLAARGSRQAASSGEVHSKKSAAGLKPAAAWRTLSAPAEGAPSSTRT